MTAPIDQRQTQSLAPKPDASVTDRLDKIEATLETLTKSVSRLVDLVDKSLSVPPSSGHPPDTRREGSTASGGGGGTQDGIAPHTFSPLEEAHTHLHRFSDVSDYQMQYQDATTNLRHLTESLGSFALESGNVTSGHGDPYIIPNVAVGNSMIGSTNIPSPACSSHALPSLLLTGRQSLAS